MDYMYSLNKQTCSSSQSWNQGIYIWYTVYIGAESKSTSDIQFKKYLCWFFFEHMYSAVDG